MQTSINLAAILRGSFLSAQWWSSLAGWASAVVLARSLPAVLALLASRRAGARTRLSAVAVVGVLSYASVEADPLVLHEIFYLLGGLAYFAALTWIAWKLAADTTSILAPSAIFAASTCACVLWPCLFVPVKEGNVVRLLGIEVALALYSLVLECRTRGARPPLTAALFFVIVNPVVVMPEQGQLVRAPAFSYRSVSRLLTGAATIAMSGLVAFAPSALWHEERPSPILYAGLILALFFIHSGAASVQVAWLHVLGWDIPERYRAPLLASTPLEFWQRWNTYFGSWLRRYLFTPIHLRCRRRYRRAPGNLVSGFALTATFVIAGVAHDLANYPADFRLTVRWSIAFAVAAAVAFLTAVLGGLWHSLTSRLGSIQYVGAALLATLVGHGAVLGHLLLLAWILYPESDGRMNVDLSTLLGLRQLGF